MPEVELEGECDEEVDAESATEARLGTAFPRRVLRLGLGGARSLEGDELEVGHQRRARSHLMHRAVSPHLVVAVGELVLVLEDAQRVEESTGDVLGVSKRERPEAPIRPLFLKHRGRDDMSAFLILEKLRVSIFEEKIS